MEQSFARMSSALVDVGHYRSVSPANFRVSRPMAERIWTDGHGIHRQVIRIVVSAERMSELMREDVVAGVRRVRSLHQIRGGPLAIPATG